MNTRSVEALRTAISSIDGAFGSLEDTARLMKGARRKNPIPIPAEKEPWDIRTVLQLLDSWGPTEELDLASLSKKTHFLLALCASWRPRSDMGRIVLKHIHLIEETEVKLTALEVKEGPAKFVTIKAFEAEPNLCPVRTIKQYLDRVKNLRDRKSKNLFIITRKPYTDAAEDTLANWAKSILKEAGIDTGSHKVHSLRGVSSSKALEAGASIDDIMKHANWRSKDTFTKFYHMKTSEKSYTEKVLS
jgi:integrase